MSKNVLIMSSKKIFSPTIKQKRDKKKKKNEDDGKEKKEKERPFQKEN